MANHKKKEWEWKSEEFMCNPGQFITSLESIRKVAGKGINTQHVRTAIKRFEKLKFLTNQSTKSGRLITVLNWDSYQTLKSQPNKEPNKDLTKTSQRPNKDLTTNNNDNNDNNDNKGKEKIYKKEKKENLEKRLIAFDSEVREFIKNNPKYKPVEQDFLDYWTEPNKSGTKMRFEAEPFFAFGKRLGTFLKNYNKNKPQTKTHSLKDSEIEAMNNFKRKHANDIV